MHGEKYLHKVYQSTEYDCIYMQAIDAIFESMIHKQRLREVRHGRIDAYHDDVTY